MIKQYSASLKKLLVQLAAGTSLIGILIILSNFPEVIERFYSKGIYPLIATGTQFIFNHIPFSVGDLLYILSVIFLGTIFVRMLILLFRKEFRHVGLMLLQTIFKIELGIIIFYLFWGMNYFRVPAAKRLNLLDSCCAKEDIRKVASILIDSANLYRSRLNDSDMVQDNDRIFNNATKAVRKISGQGGLFHLYVPRVKPSMLSYFMNYMGTAGYYNPFTSEAQLNSQMPVFLRPFVACHEMAHQSGYNAEDEANFAGFIAGTSSDDQLLKYSSFYLGVEEFMFELRMRDTVSYKELKLKISEPVLADFKKDRLYWQEYRGKAGILSSLLYDNYLKLNNQPEGLQTYNRMVKLVIAWYRKEGLL